MTDSPFSQSTYQVRMEWGIDGMRRLAASDVIVVVDVFGFPARPGHDSGAWREPVVAAARRSSGIVALGGLRTAAAVAATVLAEQAARGERTSVAVIATPAAGGAFAVENHLGAGAVVAALGDVGIDHCSPEAAVAAEAFRALRGAAGHLLTASGSGRALVAAGRRDEVLAAAAVDAASVVPLLRDGVFGAG